MSYPPINIFKRSEKILYRSNAAIGYSCTALLKLDMNKIQV